MVAYAGILFILIATQMPVALAAYVIAPDIADEYVRTRNEVTRHPDDPAAQFEYAVCLSYVGKVEQSRNALRNVRKLDPEFAAKTLPTYLHQSETRPEDVPVQFRLAFLYYFTDDNDRAYAAFERISKRQPPNQFTAWALAYMAVIRGNAKKWDEAEPLILRALELEPDAYGLHAAHAALLRGQGRIFAATGAFFRALNLRSQFENYERERFPVSENR